MRYLTDRIDEITEILENPFIFKLHPLIDQILTEYQTILRQTKIENGKYIWREP